jgi:hypothetical protein
MNRHAGSIFKPEPLMNWLSFQPILKRRNEGKIREGIYETGRNRRKLWPNPGK